MSEWIDMDKRRPTRADCDASGCVLVWHIYNGVMVYEWRNAIANEFILAWMPPPGKPEWLAESETI